MMIGKLVGSLVSAFMAGAVLVFFTVFGTLMGALSGWIVGWFFADTILTFFSYIFGASHGLQMWEIGASLGFMSGFLRARLKGDGFAMASFKDWLSKQQGKDPKVPPNPPTSKPTLVRD